MANREDVGMAELADKKAEEKKYSDRDLSRDFPQVFRPNGTVKRSTLRKKYGLREAMDLVQRMNAYVNDSTLLDNDLCLMIFSRGGMVQLTGEAAKYALRERPDTFIDLIEMGHNFRVC